jgi:hypothetical protein
MSYLNKVVNLCPTRDVGATDARPIDTRIRLNFHAVFKYGWTGLNNLVPFAAIVFGEAEPVGSDYRSILKNHVIAQTAMFSNYGV